MSLKVYESTLPIESTSGVSGLQYVPKIGQKPMIGNQFTICCRLSFQRLGAKSYIFALENVYSPTQFLWLKAHYPNTWSGLGNYELGNESYTNWILKDAAQNKFTIWTTNKWHHICIGFDGNLQKVTYVLVRLRNSALHSGRVN